MKRRARLDVAMTTMVLGKLSSTRGCCPVCGSDVSLTHSFNGARLRDSYGCYRCGPTVYTVPVTTC